MMPVNYMMPAYLTMPEPVHPDEGIGGPLVRTLFRSVGKSLGHSLAHFFDSTIFKR